MPAQIQSMLDVYASRYHVLKTPRKLVWHPQVGTVRLQLEVPTCCTPSFGCHRLEWVFATGVSTELLLFIRSSPV
jgi:hypothetical protein